MGGIYGGYGECVGGGTPFQFQLPDEVVMIFITGLADEVVAAGDSDETGCGELLI